jgi:hypothetical protein
MGWIDLAEDNDRRRVLANTAIILRVPQNVGKFLSGCTTGGFCKQLELLAHKLYIVARYQVLA